MADVTQSKITGNTYICLTSEECFALRKELVTVRYFTGLATQPILMELKAKLDTK